MIDVALHEAAHAVVAVELGATVRSVEVHDNTSGLTKLERADLPRFTTAAIAVAGYAAGRLRLERSAGDGYVEELDAAAADLDRLHQLIPGDGDEARHLRFKAMDRASTILRRRWAEVDLLADVLHERRHLDAREVAVLLGVKPPTPKRPAATPPARSGATRRTTSPAPATNCSPWLVASRSYTAEGHRVVAGVSRCLPNSPAHRSDPAAWRQMRPGETLIETRGGGTVAVR